MQIISYISSITIPVIILLIITYGIIEKNKVFDTFLIGAQEGIVTVYKILPTLVGIFLAIGALRESGIIELIIKIIKPIIEILHIPAEIMPLALLRPISGSASLAIATNIMQTYGVDSLIGKITSTIMGSTETTFYTIAVYASCVKIKKTRFVLLAALLADIAGIIASIIIWQM